MKNSDERDEEDQRDPGVDAQAGDVVGRVDPERLEVEAEAGVERDVEREERRRPEAEATVEDQQQPGGEEVPERLVEERRVERRR